MEFCVFAKKMYSVIGNGNSTSDFTRTLFDAITTDAADPYLEKSDSSYKSYFNGKAGISGIAKNISAYCDPAEFMEYMKPFPDGTMQSLCDEFASGLPGIDPYNADEKIAGLFISIIREAAGSTRVMTKEKEQPEISIAQDRDPYAEYLRGVKDHYAMVKTILYQERLVPFYEIYICNDVKIYNDNRRMPAFSKNDLKHLKSRYYCGQTYYRDITATDLMCFTHYGILRGTGGIGKSMMMRHLLFTAIDGYPIQEIVPVLVPLKSYNASDIDLLDFIVQTIRQFDSSITVEQITKDLENGKFLLLLDGLDEIASKYMVQFEDSIGKFVNQYRKNYFIISSRPISDFVSYTRFVVISLQELTKDQALALIDKIDFRPDNPEVKRKFRETLDTKLFKTHESFASNPLLLNIMLMTFERYAEVPSKMHKFYEKAYEALSQTHDATKGAFIRAFETGFDSDRFEEYLAEFCARTYMAEEYKIPVQKAKEQYYAMDVHEQYGETKKNFPQFMKDVCDNLCLMYCEKDEYNFMHRSFQEYFCALYFSRLREDDLVRLGAAFQSRSRYQSADHVFDMLYDMIPDRVEELIRSARPWE